MSGNESRGYSRRSLGLNVDDLREFATSSRATGIDVNGLSRATGVYKGDELIGGYRDPGTNDSSDAEHARIETALTAFRAFIKDRETTMAEHREYLKAVSDRPGRRATIVVPTGEPAQDQLLMGRDIGQGLL